MQYYYNPEVKFLLMNRCREKPRIQYAASNTEILAPCIGKRPPFYVNPVYESWMPII